MTDQREVAPGARSVLGRTLRCPLCGERRPPSGLLTLEEVALRLGTSQRHVRRLADERRIPIVKVGRYVRFDGHELEHWVDDHRIGVVDPTAVARAEGHRRATFGRSTTAEGRHASRRRTA